MITYNTAFLPAEVGYNADRLSVLNNHLNKMIDARQLQAASYCLSRDQKVFVNAAVGKLSYKEDDLRPLQPDTMHGVASVTKLFTAAAIFKLVEDGEMRLNQTVGEFIEEFKAPPFNNINVAHLLSHTSGLATDGGAFENRYQKSPWFYTDNMKDVSWIEAALSSGQRKQPGEEWAYSTFGYIILGEIISRVSGVFADDYIMENIVVPCEMDNSCFKLSQKQAEAHIIRNQRMEKRLKAVIDGQKEEESYWSSIPSTGGGLHSTPLDLCKFGNMLLNNGNYNGKRILGRKTIEKMITLYLTPDIKDYCWGAGGVFHAYGLGPDMRHNLGSFFSVGTFFHEGAGRSNLFIDPVEKLVAAWITPFSDDSVWVAPALDNVSAIMWSGLE